jgi:hypothetical protein
MKNGENGNVVPVGEAVGKHGEIHVQIEQGGKRQYF